eukprot:s2565_g2.t1
MIEGAAARPRAVAVWEASEEWIATQDDVDGSLLEYVTAAEDLQEADPPRADHPPDADDQKDILQQLQARIVELEAQVQQQPQGNAGYQIPRELFPAQGGGGALQPDVWAKLKTMAGPAPGRLGKHETPAQSIPLALQGAQAERAAEVVDEDEFQLLASTLTDPMQKLIALQLKQNQEMLQRLAPRAPQDSIAHALTGWGNESGSSSSGIRGCTAREAFLKQVDDHSMVARVVMQNAMKDLGVVQPYPGLMRDYLEKKVPLGDMKLLTLFGHYLAHAWEVAYVASDELMMGYVSRGLLLVEQSAMDAGKTQMGWLLVGLPEPNWSIINQNRRRSGVQPFARLAQPAWLAANTGFLKDLDFMESRLKSASNKITTKETDEGDKPSTRKPWPKKKAKGEGKEKSSLETTS